MMCLDDCSILLPSLRLFSAALLQVRGFWCAALELHVLSDQPLFPEAWHSLYELVSFGLDCSRNRMAESKPRAYNVGTQLVRNPRSLETPKPENFN